jgi:tetratricopeptide (TPR) repeat protein
MVLINRIMLVVAALVFITTPALAAKKTSAVSQETFDQYVENLKKNPRDNALREKIIKLALTMKPAPTVPENAERNMARGTTFAQKAVDTAGYKRAIAEFEAATNSAPWLALAYYNLGVVQEQADLYAETIQSLKFYLMAAPDAKNAREVKNKIYALEADVEDLKAVKNAPAAPPAAPEAVPGKSLAVVGKANLSIESEKELNIIKMPPAEKKSRIPSFIGNWFFKDTMRGEELTIQAFEISKNANGDIVAAAPKRGADYVPTIRTFEIADKTMKINIHWRMKSVVGYWKIESYTLTLSDDGTKLAGPYSQKSVGGRNIEFDRTLFRQ